MVPPTSRGPSEPAPGPLDGVRVLDFSALIAGPSCARFMADHGAEVIKFERFPDGDISRHSFGAEGDARGPMFLQQNAGKKSVCVDLKQPEGIELVLGLVPTADVVIEAFTPGVMERLGLGYEALTAINPHLILCSISGFGQSGPNRDRPGYAHAAHAMTGWLATQFLHRDPPETPRGPGIAIGDTTAGLTAFGAICAALFQRERRGCGEHIDIALFDGLFGSNDATLQQTLLADDPEAVDVWYHPVYETSDGYLTANVGPDFRGWKNLTIAMGQPELTSDPRFDSATHVRENLAEATDLVRAWLRGKTSSEAEALLTANHVACGIVHRLPEAVKQPQVTARNLVVDVHDPVLGPIKTVNSAFRYRHSHADVRGPAPTLGQHNEEVFGDGLGKSEDELADLSSRGVLHRGDA